MSVSRFLGKDDWAVSYRQNKRRKKVSNASGIGDLKNSTSCGSTATFFLSGNRTSNKDKNISKKVKQLENHLNCWKENLELERKKREEDMSKCETQLKKLKDEIVVDGDNDEGLDGDCKKSEIIREIMTQRNILRKHSKKIEKITDELEGRKGCCKLRDTREILNGQKNVKVDYKLTMEKYEFKHIKTEFVLKYKFNDGDLSVVSQKRDESAMCIVDGVSFTGPYLRKCGDKATLIAVEQAENQLSKSLQTLYNKTTEEITRLEKESYETDIEDEKRMYNLGDKEYEMMRLLGRMKKGKHKAEMLVSAYIVERLDDITENKSVDINILVERERQRKLLEMKVWTKLPDMNTERFCLGVAVGDGKLFAVGGWDGFHKKKSGEYLDLMNVNAGWTKIPDMSTGRYSLGVAFADGKLFAVGGHDDGKILKSGGYLRVSSHRYQN